MSWPNKAPSFSHQQALVVSLLFHFVSILFLNSVLFHQTFSTYEPFYNLLRNFFATFVASFVVFAATDSLVLKLFISQEESSMQRLRSSNCGHFYLILCCPATSSLRSSLFGHLLSIYEVWCRS